MEDCLTELPKDRTAVVVGNSLTGEVSRAEGLRLRWPYVADVLRVAVAKSLNGALADDEVEKLLEDTEEVYKSVLAPFTEDTLAGALSNVIPGALCTH